MQQLASELSGTAHVVSCDLADDADALPAKVDELGLGVNLLVNNAGFGTHGRFVDIDPVRDAELVRVNCEALLTLTHAFLPGMVSRRRGGVITVASTAGMQPIPFEVSYAASKAFARSFSEALSAELRGTGVKALCVNPGPCRPSGRRSPATTRATCRRCRARSQPSRSRESPSRRSTRAVEASSRGR